MGPAAPFGNVSPVVSLNAGEDLPAGQLRALGGELPLGRCCL